ncbi:DUF4388 domain-containing protein [Oceanithermus sp.]
MAIFGNLRHISIGDLLPLLAYQEGALELFNVPGRPRITLYVERGVLRAVYLNDRPADALQARSVLGELVQARRGGFEFIPGARPHRSGHELNWPLNSLMVALVSFNDEVSEAAEDLPHPDTIFRFARLPSVDDARLREFWNAAHGYLVAGASARQLSEKLGIDLDLVRFYLHRLRQLGAVEPVRVRTGAGSSRKNTAQRLLSALKRRFFG